MFWADFTSLSELKDTPLEWCIYRLFDDFKTPLCLVGKQNEIKPRRFDICFSQFLAVATKILFLERKAGYSALFPLSLKIFLIFYSFLRFLRLFFFLVWAPRPPQQQKCRGDKFLRLVSFGNSSSNSHTKFRVLDIKSRFTCGELNLYWNVNVFKLLFPGLPEYFFFCPRRLW